ncbi:hypothetical protein KCV07_g306, partial [Aureobasidium melanogenum]
MTVARFSTLLHCQLCSSLSSFGVTVRHHSAWGDWMQDRERRQNGTSTTLLGCSVGSMSSLRFRVWGPGDARCDTKTLFAYDSNTGIIHMHLSSNKTCFYNHRNLLFEQQLGVVVWFKTLCEC